MQPTGGRVLLHTLHTIEGGCLMAPRTPTEAEIRRVAEESGAIEPGAPIPPRIYARAARVIQQEAAATEKSAAATASRSSISGELLALYTDLTSGGMPDPSAARVVAALAPTIWRTESERKAAHP